MKLDASLPVGQLQSVELLQTTWRHFADPSKAEAMQAYMKHQFVFLGIATPQRRSLSLALFIASRTVTIEKLFDYARQLFDLPEREYQYLAIDLLAHNQSRLRPDDLHALLDLVQVRSWWDSVDGLISVIDKLLLTAPADWVENQMYHCLSHENKWLRRVAMLHQKSWKNATVEARLFRYALQLAPDTDFFIRKAIGWSLREYAKTSPYAVKQFLRSNSAVLSALSYREAAKHL